MNSSQKKNLELWMSSAQAQKNTKEEIEYERYFEEFSRDGEADKLFLEKEFWDGELMVVLAVVGLAAGIFALILFLLL